VQTTPYQNLNPSTTKSPKACARCAGFSASSSASHATSRISTRNTGWPTSSSVFKGAKKALPLNMTNWDSVAEITGEATPPGAGTRPNCIRPRPRCRAKPSPASAFARPPSASCRRTSRPRRRHRRCGTTSTTEFRFELPRTCSRRQCRLRSSRTCHAAHRTGAGQARTAYSRLGKCQAIANQ